MLNIQAFNKDTGKIRKEDEYGQNLWEDIKYIKPIVIIDEPQKIEGTVKKKSKSLVAIEELQPLLRCVILLHISNYTIRFISWILMQHIKKIGQKNCG